MKIFSYFLLIDKNFSNKHYSFKENSGSIYSHKDNGPCLRYINSLLRLSVGPNTIHEKNIITRDIDFYNLYDDNGALS